jgi:hypothetical protein
VTDAAPRSPEWANRNLARSKAKSAALRALGRRYPDELRRLYKTELEKAGLKPGRARRG